MKTWLRRLRGMVSIGAIWGLACSVVGFTIGAVVSLIWPEILPFTVVRYVATVALGYGIAGFVLGGGFAGVLAMMHGRKTFEELTRGRAALWGALTGVGVVTITGLINLGLWLSSGFPLARLIPLFVPTFVAMTCVFGAVTAGLGVLTVSLARRAPAELEAGEVPYESKLLGDSGESGAHQIGDK
jgi:hypothetical protein